MKRIRGLYTVLVTPFNSNDEIDEEGLRNNIRYQIQSGVNGLVALGTTGEAPTLSLQEKELVIRVAVEEAKHKVHVMIGTGSYSTKQTIENTLLAERLGADTVMIVTPYYNKPTQEGIYRHFKTIAQETSLPILIYNIPGRAGQNIQTNTLQRIAEIPQIIGVKEASGNISQMSDVIECMRKIRPDFSILSGDDSLTLPLIALGGDGILSVVSNLIPVRVKELVEASLEGNFQKAQEIHYELMPLFRSAFIETNPIPIKAAMAAWGMPSGKCRLPLCDLQNNNLEKLKETLEQYCEVAHG